MSEKRCIIIGAGHAAAQMVPSLRQEGWKGEIVLLGEEPYLPYNRPPLSKTFLGGDKHVEDLLIRPAASYEKVGVSLQMDCRVGHIDREKHEVELESGHRLPYDKLVLTTGARVRRVDLAGTELPGVYYLRNIQDVEQIRPYVAKGKKAVIVGAGYIGLETAAMLRQLGMQVTVLEMGERALNRVTAAEVSAFFTRVHQEQGVDVISGVQVDGFLGEKQVEGVSCADGRRFEADLVVLGIGILPNVELAEQAGLEVNDGIVVDRHCQSLDPDILAAGDCTRHFNPFYQRHVRLESVQNAVDQAKVAAATVCGKGKEYNALPWFWSEQYDLKLQIAGLSQDFEELVIRGDTQAGRRFAAF